MPAYERIANDLCDQILSAIETWDDHDWLASIRKYLDLSQSSLPFALAQTVKRCRGQALSDQLTDVATLLVVDYHDSERIIPKGLTAALCRYYAAILEYRHGGRSIEVRIPPYAAIQLAACQAAPVHRRGTPGNVVEITAQTFIELCAGIISWGDDPTIFVSGAHANDVASYLPLGRRR